MSDANQGATGSPPKEVFAVDAYKLFHPIRLPAEAFKDLHRETAETLDDFVAAHRERFPQQAGALSRR